jgi:DNA polymerase III subunit epsilon
LHRLGNNQGNVPPFVTRAGKSSIREFAAIDFEFARLRQGGGEVPVQIGIVTTRGGSPDPSSGFVSYLRPPGDVYPGPGLRDPRVLQDAPDFLSLWPDLNSRLRNRILLAHGTGTEKRFLRAFPGHGFGPWIDTLPLGRALLPSAQSHSLGDLCGLLEMENSIREFAGGLSWHDALYDAAACLLLFFKLIEKAELPPSSELLLHPPDLREYFHHRSGL